MHYYSTNNTSLRVSFSEALRQGLAPDGGLFMPESIPKLDASFFDALPHLSLPQIGMQVLQPYMEEIPASELESIVTEALDFPIPLVQITDHISVLELFHGPTLAFKDVAARLLARLMQFFLQGTSTELTILVATSGDTGSAVAHGFFGVPKTRVVILYPSGKVSDIQEHQLTTMGGNVRAFEVEGTFDDCQRLVKEAFVDPELANRLTMTSANSISIGRLLPQIIYYFLATAPLICVPSGNFGNLTAGLIAKRMGLPVTRFLAATNANDVIPRFLRTGIFEPHASVQTLSNAMDVGNPSNARRIFDLYKDDPASLGRDLVGVSVTDEQTRSTIQRVFAQHGYLLDPHTAVGWTMLERCLESNPHTQGVVLATAHPGKFQDVVSDCIGQSFDLPAALQTTLSKPKQATRIRATLDELKSFL